MTLKSETYYVSLQGREGVRQDEIRHFDESNTECLRTRPKWARAFVAITSAATNDFVVTTVIYDEQVRESWKREHPDEDEADWREGEK